eukprot:1169324-Pleurochrysis_carterae.AAC.1
MTSIRGPQASGDEDEFTGGALRRSRQAKARSLCVRCWKHCCGIGVRVGRRTSGGQRGGGRGGGHHSCRGNGQRRGCTGKLAEVRIGADSNVQG